MAEPGGGAAGVSPLQFFRKNKDLIREKSLRPPPNLEKIFRRPCGSDANATVFLKELVPLFLGSSGFNIFKFHYIVKYIHRVQKLTLDCH